MFRGGPPIRAQEDQRTLATRAEGWRAWISGERGGSLYYQRLPPPPR
jgi:hypothetical protein